LPASIHNLHPTVTNHTGRGRRDLQPAKRAPHLQSVVAAVSHILMWFLDHLSSTGRSLASSKHVALVTFEDVQKRRKKKMKVLNHFA